MYKIRIETLQAPANDKVTEWDTSGKQIRPKTRTVYCAVVTDDRTGHEIFRGEHLDSRSEAEAEANAALRQAQADEAAAR